MGLRQRFVSGVAMVSVIVAVAHSAIAPANASEPSDFAVPNGWFYTQARGSSPVGHGYAVVDDAKARFYSEFRRLGGVSAVGYPISDRFVWDGFETQAFQRVIFQWRPDKGGVDFVNVFDRLNDAKRDDWLFKDKLVPRQKSFDEVGKPLGVIQRDRLAILDQNPAIKRAYLAVPGDALVANGLPTSDVVDMGNVFVLRAQRVAFQLWKVNTPWAKAGDVTMANGGDLAKEAGLIPPSAIVPRAWGAADLASARSSEPPPVAPSAATRAVVGPVSINAQITTPLATGKVGRIAVTVLGGDGKPAPGGAVTVIVHFPLAADESAMATDAVAMAPIGSDGKAVVQVLIPSTVGAGTPVEVDVNAIVPPYTAKLRLTAVIK